MKAFKANPAKYVPAYGGYCAFGVSVGAKFDGDPRYWKIVDGKLYLNLNEKIQKMWLKDVPGNINKAEKSWTKIKHKDPATARLTGPVSTVVAVAGLPPPTVARTGPHEHWS